MRWGQNRGSLGPLHSTPRKLYEADHSYSAKATTIVHKAASTETGAPEAGECLATHDATPTAWAEGRHAPPRPDRRASAQRARGPQCLKTTGLGHSHSEPVRAT